MTTELVSQQVSCTVPEPLPRLRGRLRGGLGRIALRAML